MKLAHSIRTLAVPAAAFALAGMLATSAHASRSVGVDVWVQDRASYDGEVWIQFAPEREAYVALYGIFSDGRVVPVFPSAHGRGHWIDSRHPRTVTVQVPRGVYLESVQAYASREWFDPWNCWSACSPGYPGAHWRSPLEVAVAFSYPVSVWSFSLHWDSGWEHACHVGHPVRRDAPPRRLVVTSSGGWADAKWKSDDSRPGHGYDGGNGRDRVDDDHGSKNRSGAVVKNGETGRGKVKTEVVSVERGRSNGGAKPKAASEKSSESRRVSGEPKKGSRG